MLNTRYSARTVTVHNGMAPHRNSDRRECNGQISLIELGKEGNTGKRERGLLLVRKEGGIIN